MIVLGYGGYTAWNAITGGGGSDSAEAPAPSGYEALVARDAFIAAGLLSDGINVRLVGDLPGFLEAANRAIYTVGVDKVEMARLAGNASGAERDVMTSTQQSLDALQVAIIQWRDAVYNLRLGAVDDAKAAANAAIALLQSDVDRWRSVTSSG